MDWGDPSSQTQTSKFNAALFQMSRLHSLQSNINECSAHPLLYNMYLQCYNYEQWFESINSLYKECRPKLNSKQKEEGDKHRKVIATFLEKYPIHEKIRNDKEGKYENKFNRDRWKILHGALNQYEDLVREFLDKTALNSPNQDWDGL